MKSRIHLLHVVPDLRRDAGGIAASMRDLVPALAVEAVESSIATFAIDDGFPSCSTRIVLSKRNALWRLQSRLRQLLEEIRSDNTTSVIIHSHGLWSTINHSAIAAARGSGVPYIVSPHGMLQPWARHHKALRKKAAWLLYQRSDLSHASGVHVTSEAERDACIEYGIADRFITIPWGVAGPSRLSARSLSNAQPRTLLFLGRLHPIKNLEALISAFSVVNAPDWRLLIVGPDETGYRKELERLAASSNAAGQIEFDAPRYGDAKAELLSEAELLILPSHSENYGAVVAEALAHGTPAVASTGTPWSALEARQCGWWTPPDQNSLQLTLTEALVCTPEELSQMGARGRAYVSEELTWAATAQRFAKAYRALVQVPV